MADQLTPYAVSNGLAPLDLQGSVDPKAMPVLYDFSTVAVIEKDYWQDQAAGIIGAVQTVYVDNSENQNPLNFVFQGTGFKLHVPALTSGFFPVVAPTHLAVRISTVPNAALSKLQCIFMNVPMPLTTWGPVTVNIAAVNATLTPIVAPTINAGGAIVAGGVAQALFAANANRKKMFVQNYNSEAEIIVLVFASGARISLIPGATFDSGSGPVSGEAVTIQAQTTGHQFHAWEM